jgi:uncharacterized protein Yka (UPF0111/DUF47 family)
MPENFEARVSQNNISESVENDIGNEEAASIREHMASLFREGKNNRILFLRELYIHLDDIADYATITRSKEEREYAAECNTSLRKAADLIKHAADTLEIKNNLAT